jgi:hypothetical protein
MAMTDTEQHALAAVLDHQSGIHDEARMRAFYRSLCTLVEEASAWGRVRERSLPSIVDPFDDLENGPRPR